MAWRRALHTAHPILHQPLIRIGPEPQLLLWRTNGRGPCPQTPAAEVRCLIIDSRFWPFLPSANRPHVDHSGLATDEQPVTRRRASLALADLVSEPDAFRARLRAPPRWQACLHADRETLSGGSALGGPRAKLDLRDQLRDLAKAIFDTAGVVIPGGTLRRVAS